MQSGRSASVPEGRSQHRQDNNTDNDLCLVLHKMPRDGDGSLFLFRDKKHPYPIYNYNNFASLNRLNSICATSARVTAFNGSMFSALSSRMPLP